jgi:hypothetical protein
MIVLFGAASSAYAMCDLEPWSGTLPATPERVAEKIYKDADGQFAFFGKVEVTKVEKESGGKTRYDVKTISQYEGEAQPEFSIYSGMEGDCAFLAKVGDVRMMHISAKAERPYAVGVPDSYYYGVSEEEMGSFMDAKHLSGTSK